MSCSSASLRRESGCNLPHDGISGTQLRLQIILASFRGLMAKCLVVDESVENVAEFILTVNGKSPAKPFQIDGFLETGVFRTEHHGTAKGDGLLDVVDVGTETAADIDKTGVLIKLGKDSYDIENQYFAFFVGNVFRIKLVVLELSGDLLDMLHADVVRCDYHAVILGKSFQIRDEQLLIGRPGAAGDDALPSLDECLDVREWLGLLCYGCHSVETGVAAQCRLIQTNALQEV